MVFDRKVYRYWTFLTPTWSSSIKRSDIGRNLQEWNEVFRGFSVYKTFLNSVGKHKFTDSHNQHTQSDRLLEIDHNMDIRKVLGLKNPGPRKETTLQKLLGMWDVQHECNYQNVKTAEKNSPLFDWWGYYYNMFAKQILWSGMYLYNNYVAPNHVPWEQHAGDQKDYNVIGDYVYGHMQKYEDETGVKHWYYPQTEALSTLAFNNADYILTGGDFCLNGSGMYFINPVVPERDLDWFAEQSDDFKKVFKKQGPYGKNYLTVCRPFGKYLWVNDTEVDIQPYFGRPYFRLGNRISISSVAELED